MKKHASSPRRWERERERQLVSWLFRFLKTLSALLSWHQSLNCTPYFTNSHTFHNQFHFIYYISTWQNPFVLVFLSVNSSDSFFFLSISIHSYSQPANQPRKKIVLISLLILEEPPHLLVSAFQVCSSNVNSKYIKIWFLASCSCFLSFSFCLSPMNNKDDKK